MRSFPKEEWSRTYRFCANCGVFETEGNKFKVCARCKAALYCSRECQRMAWKDHKKRCGWFPGMDMPEDFFERKSVPIVNPVLSALRDVRNAGTVRPPGDVCECVKRDEHLYRFAMKPGTYQCSSPFCMNLLDPAIYVQTNCALFELECTIVPGRKHVFGPVRYCSQRCFRKAAKVLS